MLLPIVNRELRVSARNKATHRLRILFAVGAVRSAEGLASSPWRPAVLAVRNLAFGH